MSDFRYAFRGLRRSPAVAIAAVVSLGLGIGATTSIFSVGNAVVLRSLPVQKPSEIVVLRYVSQKGNVFDSFGYEEYRELGAVSGVLSGLAAVFPTEMNLASEEATERIPGQIVSGTYFQLLGVKPRIGRLIEPEDDRLAGGRPVCAISYSLWLRRFGSAPDVAGRQIRINGRPYTIVGVAPQGFDGVEQGSSAQVYVPLMLASEISTRQADPTLQPPFLKWTDWLQMVGRLRPGVSRDRAQAMLDARFAQMPLASRKTTFEMANRHDIAGTRARLLLDEGRQGFDDLRYRYQRSLAILFYLAGGLLAIACANVANLLLARATGRRKEIAIRVALGGGPWRLVRQLMAESLLLGAGGAALGMLMATWMSDLLVRLADSKDLDPRPDLSVAAFVVGVTILTAVLFGLAPALAAVRARVGSALKNEGAGVGRRQGKLGGALVMAQVALSVTLLAGAGLLLRSLHNLESVQPGFQPENVALASLNPGANRYGETQARTLFASLLERAETIPGVRNASAALVSPLSGNLWMYSVNIPGYTAAPGETTMANFNAVGPGYFAALGSGLLRGREFTRADRAGANPVAVISEEAARKFWPGRDPVGQRFQIGGQSGVEVVGVVRDSIYRDLREARPSVVYLPLLQGDFRSATLVLRMAGDPGRVFGDLRAAARQVDAGVPLFDMRTLDAQIAGTLTRERMLAVISAIFGALALILAVLGLYGVLAYSVAQRAREIGIRMALGAAQRQVVGVVIGRALLLLAGGLALGVPLSILTSRWITSSLYGLKPGDALTYTAVVGVLAVASLAAAVVPSRRAARVDPMVVLRCD